jgi:hypothetical protein
MARFDRLKVVLKWCALVPIMGCFIVTLFTWALWLACKPLSDLAQGGHPSAAIPPGAMSYSVNKTGVMFFNHATVAEDPASFALLTALLLTLGAAIGYSYLRDRRAARKRGLGPTDFS